LFLDGLDGFPSPYAAVAPLDLESLVLVLAASSAGAVLSRLHHRVVLPTVVLEIVLGIVIGPEVLGIAEVDTYVNFLANLGLALLFFFAGLEVVEKRVPRPSLERGTLGWGLSLGIGLALGAVLHGAGLDAEWWLLAVALSTTSLGTLVPILSDAGLLPTRLGSAVLGTGVAGEFWPIVFISVFLTGAYGAVAEVLLLVVFGALVTLAAAAALRARFDFVLGAFAAGLVVGLTLGSPQGEPVRMRLEGIGFGFLIPVYFVATGMNFDLDSLLSPTGLGLAALFLSLLVVVRGASSFLWLRDLGGRETLSLALFGATALPLIVAIVGIGTQHGAIAADVGTSLIGAGMISVLVFPLLAITIAGRATPAVAVPSLAVEEDEY
jgi:Kef-type K+ transport system membrane component KefB